MAVERTKIVGKSSAEAERAAASEAMKVPQFQAVRAWQDTNAEIKLKKALVKMMSNQKIAALIIRSINLKALFALKDLGLKLPGDAKILSGS